MTQQFFKLKGKLLYEPARQDLKKTFKAKTLIVQFPFDDLANVYRWFIKQQYHINVDPPMWGNHVTVVRGDEKPPVKDKWKAHEGQVVELEVSPHLYKIWQFWALPVRCERLLDIRRELGLTARHELHVTIGREMAVKPFGWSKRQLAFLNARPVYDAVPVKQARVSQVVDINGRKVLTLKKEKA